MSAPLQDPPVSAFLEWMKAIGQHVESALDAWLPAATEPPQRLHAAMRYATLDGGKRIRPLLVFAAGMAFDADHAELDRAAVAVELIHAYSLVHDDMPEMDNDLLRRGRPTVHVAYDAATALLVGDALQTLAFEVLAGSGPALAARRVEELARASGSRGMAGGQAIDLLNVGQALDRTQLETMHSMKNGALLRCSVRLGALGAGLPPPELSAALDQYTGAIGLAFQVVDDILDVNADTTTLGKTAGKDAAANKPTFVSMLGLEQSIELAERLRTRAHEAAARLPGRTERLHDLADFIVRRGH
ncbi:polyprenyl synthetase family protein [soil metagenome]